MNSPTKRIAWITGGGTGIGLAGAISLSKEGWQVVISGRRSDVLSRAADAIRSQGGSRGPDCPRCRERGASKRHRCSDTEEAQSDRLTDQQRWPKRSKPELGKRDDRRLEFRR